MSDEPDLHLLVDGVRVDAGSRHGSANLFALAGPPASVRVVSWSAVPAEPGVARDYRELGVGLRRVALRQGTRFRVIEATDAMLTGAFHAFEPGAGVRWTDGDATLPAGLFDGFDGSMDLVLHIGCTARYPLITDPAQRTAA